MDTLRKYNKIIAIILIMLSITLIYSFKTSIAKTRNGASVYGVEGASNSGSYSELLSKSQSASGVLLYGGVFYYNDFTYCMEMNRTFLGATTNSYWKYGGSFDISTDDSRNDPVLNGYAYILNQSGRTRRCKFNK